MYVYRCSYTCHACRVVVCPTTNEACGTPVVCDWNIWVVTMIGNQRKHARPSAIGGRKVNLLRYVSWLCRSHGWTMHGYVAHTHCTHTLYGRHYASHTRGLTMAIYIICAAGLWAAAAWQRSHWSILALCAGLFFHNMPRCLSDLPYAWHARLCSYTFWCFINNAQWLSVLHVSGCMYIYIMEVGRISLYIYEFRVCRNNDT